jgi:hypothetical protein
VNPLDLLSIGRDAGLRFTLVGLLPTGVFAALVLAIAWSGAPADAPDLGAISDKAADLSATEGGLILLAILAVAVLLQPLQVGLVRLLEGYWGDSKATKGLAERRKAPQRERFRELASTAGAPMKAPDDPARADAVAAAAELRRLFPEEESDLLPTRLGNVLRAAETRAGSPYGLEAIVVWPRLYPLLPDPVRGVVDDQRGQLDASARFCVVFAAAAVTSFALLVWHPVWLWVPLACVVLAALAYRAAVGAALQYGESLRAAFDLHRFDLLSALHLPLPPDRTAEREQNRDLSDFLIQDWEIDFEYDHEGASRTGADRS